MIAAVIVELLREAAGEYTIGVALDHQAARLYGVAADVEIIGLDLPST